MYRQRLTASIDDTIQQIRAANNPLSSEAMSRLLQRDCVSRQCLRVTILRGKLYVVAPESERCTYDDLVAGSCSKFARQRTEGVAANFNAGGGKWDPTYSPTSLKWHFAAGVNISSCAGSIIPGDFNGAFTRLRFLTSLRLLEEAARSGTVSDTELILCLQETPLNAGGWCLRGAQPIFAMVTNVEAPMLAFPHWLPRFRDVDFALWDEARRAESERGARTASTGAGARVRKAAFRGGVYRLSIYSDRWRARGCRKTLLTDMNWRRLGRTALLHALSSGTTASLVDANIGIATAYAKRLGLNATEVAKMSEPPFLSLEDQASRFRYALNIEGHGGWADRLIKLFLSPLLVLAQDLAPQLWFEGAMRHGDTHLAVDSNLRNLSAVINWARRHDGHVSQMVQNAHAAMEELVSLKAIRLYVRELLAKYTKNLLGYRPVRLDARAVRFQCTGVEDDLGSCHIPGRFGKSARRKLFGTRCYFVGPSSSGKRRFDTLHDAAEALLPPISSRSPAAPSAGIARSHAALLSARKLVCSLTGRTAARAKGQWCYNHESEDECHRHTVPGGSQAGCSRRACVWRPRLHALGVDTDALCPRSSNGKGILAKPAAEGACVAMCPCAALCATAE